MNASKKGMTAESVQAVTESLRKTGKSFTEAPGFAEATSDQKLIALMLTLITSAAADMLDGFLKSDGELRSAIQAAVESLSDVPDASATRAMLEAALVAS